ncbi:MAG: VOC family protein [Dethiobacter sp.]|jgi:methylmalonyl-CoA epimerase|nr:MAG: VOC family protein [Dethiobacter sp.]
MMKRIHHVGIVVGKLEEALDLYVNTLGFRQSDVLIPDKGEKFKSVMVSLDGLTIELIEPMDLQGSMQRFLETRGEGLHHFSIEVEDLRQKIDELAAKGMKFIMKEPERVGETLVTFVHPKATRGVLIELLQKV